MRFFVSSHTGAKKLAAKGLRIIHQKLAHGIACTLNGFYSHREMQVVPCNVVLLAPVTRQIRRIKPGGTRELYMSKALSLKHSKSYKTHYQQCRPEVRSVVRSWPSQRRVYTQLSCIQHIYSCVELCTHALTNPRMIAEPKDPHGQIRPRKKFL